jgi:hypothetical protein
MPCTLNGTSPSALIVPGVANALAPRDIGENELLNTLMPDTLAAYNWVCAWLMANPVQLVAGVVTCVVAAVPTLASIF